MFGDDEGDDVVVLVGAEALDIGNARRRTPLRRPFQVLAATLLQESCGPWRSLA